MEYIILGIALWLMFNIYLFRMMSEEKKRQIRFEKSLHSEYGKPTSKTYLEGRLDTLKKHFNRRGAEYVVDDITWSDLDMDRVFGQMDFTFSSAGEESLYTMLRTPVFDEKILQRREELIAYFMEHEQERVNLSLYFAKIGRTGRYSIYDYIDYLDNLKAGNNRKHIAMLWFMFASIMLAFLSPGIGIFLFVILMIVNMVAYFREKAVIDPYITTFEYFIRILNIAKEFKNLDIPVIRKESEIIQKNIKTYDKFMRFSFLITHKSDMSGNPLDVIIDYLHMTFHLNLMKFNSMLEDIRNHNQEILEIIDILGMIESMISIGAYRKTLDFYSCPEYMAKDDSDCKLSADDLYHPLISDPVANSFTIQKGMLLTGSNASGKSTFLKTVAINQILAQTFHMTLSHAYKTEFYRVYSSMSLRDDLMNQDSYFIVEIKAMKRILDEIAKGYPVMSFVDEVLRGTNTVERIASSTYILKALNQAGALSFAATHDIELSHLLEDEYENYHFEEKIVDDDVKFNYCLLEGPTKTRNAIALLSLLGYDEAIIKQAEGLAANFMKTGEWKK